MLGTINLMCQSIAMPEQIIALWIDTDGYLLGYNDYVFFLEHDRVSQVCKKLF
jgi:hypothetical protein